MQMNPKKTQKVLHTPDVSGMGPAGRSPSPAANKWISEPLNPQEGIGLKPISWNIVRWCENWNENQYHVSLRVSSSQPQMPWFSLGPVEVQSLFVIDSIRASGTELRFGGTNWRSDKSWTLGLGISSIGDAIWGGPALRSSSLWH